MVEGSRELYRLPVLGSYGWQAKQKMEFGVSILPMLIVCNKHPITVTSLTPLCNQWTPSSQVTSGSSLLKSPVNHFCLCFILFSGRLKFKVNVRNLDIFMVTFYHTFFHLLAQSTNATYNLPICPPSVVSCGFSTVIYGFWSLRSPVNGPAFWEEHVSSVSQLIPCTSPTLPLLN